MPWTPQTPIQDQRLIYKHYPYIQILISLFKGVQKYLGISWRHRVFYSQIISWWKHTTALISISIHAMILPSVKQGLSTFCLHRLGYFCPSLSLESCCLDCIITNGDFNCTVLILLEYFNHVVFWLHLLMFQLKEKLLADLHLASMCSSSNWRLSANLGLSSVDERN